MLKKSVTALAVGSVFGAIASLLLLAHRFALRVVTPPGNKVFDEVVRARRELSDGSQAITLRRTRDTSLLGEYSLVSENFASITNIGEIISEDSRSVTRRIRNTFGAELHSGDRVKFCGWEFLEAAQLGFHCTDISFGDTSHPMPAWLLKPENAGAGNLWAIHVHGRATHRAETLRGARIATGLGMTSLVVSYRGDAELAPHLSERFALGASEWQDVEAAMSYALRNGASGVIIFGISMGASLGLQAALLGEHRQSIRAFVFDSPALDWKSILKQQAKLAHLPGLVGQLGALMLAANLVPSGSPRGIPFSRLDAAHVLQFVDVPVLILHSADDTYVPIQPARDLAACFSNVTLQEFHGAEHVKLWNRDAERYERAIVDWLNREKIS